MNLYWVITKDRYEDCFIAAENELEAKHFHSIQEGYEISEVSAKSVCKISDEIVSKNKLTHTYWVDNVTLKDLGALFYNDEPRVVNISGKVYSEKSYPELSFSDQVRNETGVYIINNQNTDRYKIGLTNDLKTRLRQFSTGNPIQIKLIYFVQTKHYKSLEKHLHELFKQKRARGEWFVFDDEDLVVLKANLFKLVELNPNDFEVYDFEGW